MRLRAAKGVASDMSGQSDNVVRLGSAEQAAIAEELRRYWQHVVEEGVPEDLRALILRFEKSDEDADQTESGVVVLADFRRGDRENPA
jgi:anti-sigma factor NepR-like protein